jgi:hypothetical protein
VNGSGIVNPPLLWFFSIVVDGKWQPGIGDPSPMGWATTAGYFLAALLCFRAALSARRADSNTRHKPLFWLLFALILLMLGVNKQLDLQTWFTFMGKNMAKAQGWYGDRHVVQGAFILFMMTAGLFGVGGLGWMLRGTSPIYKLAMIGLTFLIVFVVIRAVSLHNIDRFIGHKIEGITMNVILENAGILCVAISALWLMKVTRRRDD